MRDMKELRREVEQLRNEVRRDDDRDKKSDNNAVILDWLIETVKELQSETRNLESKLSEEDCVKAGELRLLQSQINNLRNSNLELKDRQEKNIASLAELKIKLNHVGSGGENSQKAKVLMI